MEEEELGWKKFAAEIRKEGEHFMPRHLVTLWESKT